MSQLKIILLCSTRFALPALKELAFFGMLSAVAIPQSCDELIENVHGFLNGSGINLIKLDQETFSETLRQTIDEKEINMGLVMTFPYKIPAAVYDLPAKGFYNVHPGPLPQYRGADPIFQQIKNKEKYAGVTIHKLNDGFDKGPVVINEMIKTEVRDTHGLLTTKLAELAAKLTRGLMNLASSDIIIPSKPQNESKANYYKKQTAADIMINWQTMDAGFIVALINACNPWNKGAVAKLNNQVIRLLEAEAIASHTSLQEEPGYIISLDEKGMMVSTIHDGAINIKIVYADEGFLPAHRLASLDATAGTRFEMLQQ